MDPGDHSNQGGSVMEFSFVHRPQYQSGSCSVYVARASQELLSLFLSALILVDSSKTEDSLKSFVQHEGRQMSEKDSGKDVVNPSEGELRSQKVRAGQHNTSLGLSTFRASKYVADKATLQKPLEPATKPRQKASLPSSKTLETNGSGSVLLSGASVPNVTRSTRRSITSRRTASVQGVGGQDDDNRPANKGKKHGSRRKSSRYMGVTHYKRSGRWEAHIWKRGKQIYLGSFSTSERAARAYDRAAIHFRRQDAVLNFYFHDYAGEIRQLMEMSDDQVVKMLREQSAGRYSISSVPARTRTTTHFNRIRSS